MENSTGQSVNNSYRSLLRASGGLIAQDVKRIRKALNVAIKACEGQKSITGVSPVIHALSVARIVAAEMNLGASSTIAAVMHGATGYHELTEKWVSVNFGRQVALILNGIRKINAVEIRSSVNQAEAFRKLLMSLADDVRVILIKLAERLDEVRNLERADENVKLQIASESYFLYAPLAHRLGLYNMKSEMEDLSMKYLEPYDYDHIEVRLKQTSSSRNRLIKEFTTPVREKLDNTGISYTIKSRTKSIHSIWQKMKKQGVEFEEVYDIFAVRVILDSPPEREKADCWQVYSLLTDIYQPNPSRLRDWISVPKSNGYESLHTTVIGPRGKWVEIQIRSRRMDEIAERGLAAHYRYKGIKGERGGPEAWLQKMKELLESSAGEEDTFIDQVKSDLYSDEVFVFTPKGELRQLPAGSTILDFAFDIHTEVGSRCVGAKVNGKNVSLKYTLKNGDQVAVITAKNQKPKRDWLSIVVTGKARTRIKQALNEERVTAAAKGKEILMRRMKNWKINFSDTAVNSLMERYDLKNAQDLYVGISNEDIDLLGLKEYLINLSEESAKPQAAVQSFPDKGPVQVSEPAYADYLIIENRVEGIDYKLAKCCNPVYGDAVFGFVTITEGIKIHRTACPNADNMISRYPYRILPARWTESRQSQAFVTSVKVSGIEDIGIVSRISDILNKQKVTVRSFNYSMNDGLFEGIIQLTIPNVNILNGLIRKIRLIKGVSRATRTEQ
ncbi:MAG: RelA/SpoT family protein [Bacteroidales bacterium]